LCGLGRAKDCRVAHDAGGCLGFKVDGDPRRIAFSRAGKIGAVTNGFGYLTFIK
jgi:hypothetical protein